MEQTASWQFGPFLIDLRERVLRRDGQLVPLTPKAFDVLAALVEEPGRLVSKDDLLRKVWPDTFVEESNLAYHVFALRKALGDTAETSRYIETVPKRGYRFAAAITAVQPASSAVERSAEPAEAAVGAAIVARAPAPIVVPDSARASSTAEKDASLAISRRWALMALAPVLGAVWYVAAPPWRAPAADNVMRAVPLTSLPGVVRAPSLSPDGAYVVFSWNGPKQDNQDLYVQQIGAGSPLRLTTDSANDYSPSWSPDGRAIAFLRRVPTGRTSEVRVIAPLGGSERKVADITPALPAYRPLTLAWCPDSTCIVTTDSVGPRQPDAIFAIAIDSGERRQLTQPVGMSGDVDPAISPDGRHLVFRRDTTPFSGTLYRKPLRGNNAEPGGPEAALTSTVSAGKAAWLPDSREVVFSDRGALWRINGVEGGAPVRLAYVGQDGTAPVVSRTAGGRQRLIYVRSFADSNVWRLDVDLSGPTIRGPAQAIGSTRVDLIPNLAPDGHRLAFLSDRSGQGHIWIAGTDGADAVQVTSLDFRSAPGFPRWSPDGTSIAFHGDPNGRPEVFVVPARGGVPRSLTATLSNAGFPSFSRDGRWLYFTSGQPGEFRIWKMPVAGGTPVKVTENAGSLSIESRDGRELFYLEATERPSAVWRQPLDGGAPEKIIDGVVAGLFDVTDGGIYYVERVVGEAGTGSGVRHQLQYLDLTSRRSMTVAPNLGPVTFGLTATADGRTVYFSRVDSSIDELTIVDGFR